MTFQGGNSTECQVTGGSQTIGGTGQIDLNGNTVELVSATGSSLTIGSGITIHGGGSIVGAITNKGTLLADSGINSMGIEVGTSAAFNNQGTIETSTGGTLDLNVGPSWSNTGLIKVAGGTIEIAGTFSQTSLGPFQYVSGSVAIDGTIANTGQTLALSANTGSWTLGGIYNSGSASGTIQWRPGHSNWECSTVRISQRSSGQHRHELPEQRRHPQCPAVHTCMVDNGRHRRPDCKPNHLSCRRHIRQNHNSQFQRCPDAGRNWTR